MKTVREISEALIDNGINFDYDKEFGFCIELPSADEDRIVFSNIYHRWLIIHENEIENLNSKSFNELLKRVNDSTVYEILTIIVNR